VGSTLTKWVLTRAIDYDNPLYMDMYDIVPVVAGSANKSTFWMLKNIVNSIGSSNILFSQNTDYSFNPNDNVTPSGTISMWGGNFNAIPYGWLRCDGSAVSRTTYFILFQAIGTKWGTGDGSSTFNLPDCRGLFPRGVEVSSESLGRDPDKTTRTALSGGNTGPNVGSYQLDDQFRSHTHSGTTNTTGSGHTHNMQGYANVQGGVSGGTQVRTRNKISSDPSDSDSAMLTTGSTHTHTFTTDVSGGSETRPANFYVHFIIKT
jgi:microcystin-dependent protein